MPPYEAPRLRGRSLSSPSPRFVGDASSSVVEAATRTAGIYRWKYEYHTDRTVMTEEPEVTTIGERGQVVIPKSLRKHLGVQPKTKFIVFGKGDTIILRRLRLPDVRRQWDQVLNEIDAKKLRMTSKDVAREVQARRRARRKN